MKRFITHLCICLLFASCATLVQINSEEITLKNNDVELPGTLSFSTKKSPLVIWVHGSGAIDRNGNQPAQNVGANYIKQFGDSINKKGISFFSYDKRTANKNNMASLKKGVLFADFVADVKTVVNHFKDDKRFSKIILVGHSQGSLTAMLALENVDKYISLAGPSDAADQIMIRQISEKNPLMGAAVKSHFKELMETGKIEKVNPILATIFSKPNLPFLKSWAAINPSEQIKKVTIPTLIINGDKDLQVRVVAAENLHKAQPVSTLKIIKGMNHVLKTVKDDENLPSYFTPDFPLSEELIETVVTFIKK